MKNIYLLKLVFLGSYLVLLGFIKQHTIKYSSCGRHLNKVNMISRLKSYQTIQHKNKKDI